MTDIGILDTDPRTTIDRNNSHMGFTGSAVSFLTVKHVVVGDFSIDPMNTDVHAIAKAMFKSQAKFSIDIHRWS